MKKLIQKTGLFIFLITILFLAASNNSFALNAGDEISGEIMEKISKEDKIIVLDFFASWCHSCKLELPLLASLYNKIDKSKYDIIGVDCDKDPAKGIAFQKSLNLNFKVINDNNLKMVSKFKPIGMPALYYVYKNKILKVRYGAINNLNKVVMNDVKLLEKQFVKVNNVKDSGNFKKVAMHSIKQKKP